MTRDAHPRERAVGMEVYASDVDGVGGRLRDRDEGFRVVEREAFATEPVDAPTGDYPYLVCRVTLHGWDTNDYARRLSDAMGISRERVSWAGTKDKHAVTTQLFSVQGVDPDDLPDVDGADLEVVGRAGRDIYFGDLAGNEFQIRISDVDAPENASAVTDALREWGDVEEAGESTVAVPNFFGQQRFGSQRPVTHEVGLAIARGDWKGAVLAYVANPNDAEREGTREAREVAASGDWQAALDAYPRRLRYERTMLHTLVERDASDPADYRAALEALPSNLQALFVHAAQSYVFNRVLSERLRRGIPFHRPVAGDVVCFADGDAPDDLPVPDPDRAQRVSERRVDTIARHCERGRAFVTAPLVGTDTDLADGEPGEIERSVLDDCGLEPGDFDLPGEFESTGTRRAIRITTPVDVDAVDGEDALDVAFALPSGSYATTVLREYCKVDPLQLT
ncbi:tRNA pseudouridine(13) synthase TruD [Halorubellus sp. PRR65]|uniref:tRNA pseudouridine(13) synthase TruD n=1 Tax=Halorubellus sp. PRR65 TaxID=3098148 RepID=UPI002B262C35|nr:tRNA pseudouridine(13) synthase TruD [Halorubellus sp. PRR65]